MPDIMPRICATEVCTEPVEGLKLYCKDCLSARRRKIRRLWRVREEYVDPLPFGPPTSMDWLAKFGGWIKSGMSYGIIRPLNAKRKTKREAKNERFE